MDPGGEGSKAMIVQIEIIERGTSFEDGIGIKCQESSCKRDANAFMKIRTLGQVWGVWSCTADADGLELEISKAKAMA